jgi:FRG domain
MNGTWQGPYSGTNTGQIVVGIDDMGDHFRGCAYAYDNNKALPSTFAIISTANKGNKLNFKAPLFPLHPQTGEPTKWETIANLYQGQNITMPTSADVECEWDDKHLNLNWITEIATSGSADIAKSKADQPSTCHPLAMTWEEFKKYVAGFEQFRFIYRGQTNTWRLRSPFHRTGRGDMSNFFAQDIPALHRSLSARTTHVFNLVEPLQNAAFLNLVQHHGYPTPLLDWTYSPFVAAYFAYHDVRMADAAKATPDQKVRIFVFDAKEWRNSFHQILNASVRWQHFSLIEPIAIENARLIPQQALSSFTTVDDIETYIADKEAETGKQFLRVVDLPLADRDRVIRELTLMGVTAGSLFPGIEGTCEELRERFFRYSSLRDQC